MNRSYILIGACAVAAVAAIIYLQSNRPEEAAPVSASVGGAMVSVKVPPLNGNAVIGQNAYESACAACHGPNAAGTKGVAPPLIHRIYEPGHHADESFQRAVANGVRSHHWQFGDMPPVSGLTRGDVIMIIAYIRELQQANGIH